ncbi:MAG: flavin reductase [Clostridia bacterium]|nr:flavin reductase [Clostridia bacterium]
MDMKALWKLTYGLYLLTAHQDGRDNGCIINTAVQVAEHPVRVAISVIRGGLTHDMALATGQFTLTALSVDAPFALYQHFGMQSGRAADKFAGRRDVARGTNGLLHLTEASCGHLDCKVMQTVDLGSHTLFIAEVVDGAVHSDRPACTYAHYQAEIKPRPQPVRKKGWICSVCGFVYEGDEVPEDFLCPLCKHGREDFVPAPSALEAALTQPTQVSLTGQIDAEFASAREKAALADLARAHGLDAIADTVMEMARDEARHGKALQALLERHFG